MIAVGVFGILRFGRDVSNGKQLQVIFYAQVSSLYSFMITSYDAFPVCFDICINTHYGELGIEFAGEAWTSSFEPSRWVDHPW